MTHPANRFLLFLIFGNLPTWDSTRATVYALDAPVTFEGTIYLCATAATTSTPGTDGTWTAAGTGYADDASAYAACQAANLAIQNDTGGVGNPNAYSFAPLPDTPDTVNIGFNASSPPHPARGYAGKIIWQDLGFLRSDPAFSGIPSVVLPLPDDPLYANPGEGVPPKPWGDDENYPGL